MESLRFTEMAGWMANVVGECYHLNISRNSPTVSLSHYLLLSSFAFPVLAKYLHWFGEHQLMIYIHVQG